MNDEWTQVSQSIPQVFAGKFTVKRHNAVEQDAFFYADAMAWIAFYRQKTSHWWNASYPHERLDDVIAWKTIQKQ